MVTAGGREVGSELIGQTWNDAHGAPDPHWFQPRPSHGGYDPLATGPSQLGASDPTPLAAVRAAREEVAAFDGVPPGEVPPDAVTGSASAVDPHISPAYARLRAGRVAAANGLPPAEVRALVEDHVEGRDLGFLGQGAGERPAAEPGAPGARHRLNPSGPVADVTQVNGAGVSGPGTGGGPVRRLGPLPHDVVRWGAGSRLLPGLSPGGGPSAGRRRWDGEGLPSRLG
jgi:K+-transporting ATPase c subunit